MVLNNNVFVSLLEKHSFIHSHLGLVFCGEYCFFYLSQKGGEVMMDSL